MSVNVYDFCFELTPDEAERMYTSENYDLKGEVVPNWYHLSKGSEFSDLKYSPHLPKAFTHLGCNMLATVLKSKRAVQRAIQIIRTFTALESGGYDRAIMELRESQEKLWDKISEMEEKHTREITNVKESLHFLLWENQPESSPILQIQKQIHRLEEKIETLFMDGRFRRLGLQEIYKDTVALREYVEKEMGKVWKDRQNLGQAVFDQEDKLSRIGQEALKLEHPSEAMLREKELSRREELPPAPSPEARISPDHAEKLKKLVHQKAKEKRGRINGFMGGI